MDEQETRWWRSGRLVWHEDVLLMERYSCHSDDEKFIVSIQGCSYIVADTFKKDEAQKKKKSLEKYDGLCARYTIITY